MPKKNRFINGFINFVEESSELNLTSFSPLDDIRLGFVTLIFFLVAVNTSSPIFAVLFLISLPIFVGRMIWRRKKKQDAEANAEFSTESEDDYYEYNNTTKQFERVSAKGFTGYTENTEERIQPKSFTGYPENIVDSWDIKDEKPPWEL